MTLRCIKYYNEKINIIAAACQGYFYTYLICYYYSILSSTLITS